MTGPVVGRARITITSETDPSQIDSEASKLESRLQKLGRAAAVATAAAVGAALAGGFRRLADIQQAEAVLTGLGQSTGQVTRTMKAASNAVEGTRFALNDAAKAATALTVSGVGIEQLENTLEGVANVALVSGSQFNEIASIFQKVAAEGKVTGEVLAQLSDRGVPALSLLAEHLGLTAEETRKLVSEGEIGFQEFSDAMRIGLGDAAQAAGRTVTGTFANLRTAINRLGAVTLGPAFEELPELFESLTRVVNALAPTFQPLGLGLQLAAQLMTLLAGAAEALSPVLQPLITGFLALRIAASVATGVRLLGTALTSTATASAGAAGGLTATALAARGLGIAIRATGIGLLIGLVTELSGAFDDGAEQAARLSLATQNLSGTLSALGAVTADTREAVATVLSTEQIEGFGTAAELARQFGVDLDLLTTAALGNEQAFEQVATQVLAKAEGDITATQAAGQLLVAIQTQAGAVQEATTQLRNERDALGEVQAAEKLAADQANALVEAVNALNGALTSAVNTEVKFEAALDTLTKGLKDNGDSFDLNTKKGRENATNLAGVSSAIDSHVQAMREQGATTTEINAFLAEASRRYRGTGVEVSKTSGNVRALDKNLRNIPSNVDVDVEADTTPAEREVDRLVQQIGNTIATVFVQTRRAPGSGGLAGFASGGLFRGAGSGTSDSNYAPWISDGEFIVNAAATKRNLPLLTAINDGQRDAAPSGRMQDGGLVDGSVGVGATIVQNFYGPQTSGSRLREIDWTLRYATGFRATAGVG